LPENASKQHEYECSECSGELIIKQGNIRIHHFAHKNTIDCSFYNRGGETPLHWNGKRILKDYIETFKKMNIIRKCSHCINKLKFDLNFFIDNSFNYVVKLEHNFINGIADIALLQGNNHIKYIFEVFNTHKTKEENRIGDYEWFEINVLHLNNLIDTSIFECLRDYKCKCCILKSICKIHIYNQSKISCKYAQEKQVLEQKIQLEKHKEEQEKQLLEQKIQLEKHKEEQKKRILEREIQNKKYEEEQKKRILEREIQNKKYEEERNNQILERQKQYERQQFEEAQKLILEREIHRKKQIEQKQLKLKDLEECLCGIKLINICKCSNPRYELVKLNNKLWCNNCNKWKDLCLIN